MVAGSFSGVAYRDYSRCLPDYLRDLAERAYQARNRQIERLTSPSAIKDRQRWARETFWKLIGGIAERTPLKPRTTGSFDRPGYKLEKVVYESQAGLALLANLYIPSAGAPPFPGVLFQMGHSGNGKASILISRCARAWRGLGYLVLAFDPMGQGERIYYPNAGLTRTRLFSSGRGHTTPETDAAPRDTSSRSRCGMRSQPGLLAAHPWSIPTSGVNRPIRRRALTIAPARGR